MCLTIENWTLTLLVVDELEKGQNEYTEFQKQLLWSTIISERLFSVNYLPSNVLLIVALN